THEYARIHRIFVVDTNGRPCLWLEEATNHARPLELPFIYRATSRPRAQLFLRRGPRRADCSTPHPNSFSKQSVGSTGQSHLGKGRDFISVPGENRCPGAPRNANPIESNVSAAARLFP